MTKNFYITTPIYYPNDRLHIGHAYTTVAGDAMARYKRLRGYQVLYLTGTDEHGQKIERRAKSIGKEPQVFVDEIVSDIKKLWEKLDISYDDFIRTTQERHKTVVQKIFQKLLDQDDIYLGEYEGWYCVDCESFFTDFQVNEGKCPDCGRSIQKIKEQSYFFRMSKYADRLLAHYEQNPDFIEPSSRKKEMIQNFIKPGLEDLSVSRSTFQWGIPVPGNPKHVMYVWLDALTNYLTASGYLSSDQGKQEIFNQFWPADVHLVGKDIVRFHVVYWPIFLMALGLPLPKKVFAHGFFLVKGDKMSKSKGNVINPVPIIDHYGLDTLRYYLLREVSFGADGSFTPETFVERINADLANDLGNLLHRTLTMIQKYQNGNVGAKKSDATPYDEAFEQLALQTVERVEKAMNRMQFAIALTAIWELVRAGNRYIESTEPWKLVKDLSKQETLSSVLFHLFEALRFISIMIQPFMTQAPKKMWEQLQIEVGVQTAWDSLYQFGSFAFKYPVQRKEPLFPRLEVEEEIQTIVKMIEQSAPPKKEIKEEPMEAPTQITIDDFNQVELRVAQVLSVEKMPKADRLLILQLDLGTEKRQVVSGIAEYVKAQDLIGQKLICVTNLKPVKLRGVQSEGMILAASTKDQLGLATLPDEIPNGTLVK